MQMPLYEIFSNKEVSNEGHEGTRKESIDAE
jgi:hypothetical protein